MSSTRIIRSITSTASRQRFFPRPVLHTTTTTTSRLATSRPFHTTSPNMVVNIINTADEYETTIKDNKIVILDAFATWCGPCKAIAPIIEKLSDADEFKDTVHFTKFDTDDVPELTEKLGITAMPTFLLFKDGEKVDQVVGANPQAIVTALAKQVGA